MKIRKKYKNITNFYNKDLYPLKVINFVNQRVKIDDMAFIETQVHQRFWGLPHITTSIGICMN